MVHRHKDLNNPPAEFIDAKWDALRVDVLVTQDKHDVKTACYRDCTLDALMDLYKNKCAICERDRGEELEIDHYRPKKPRNNMNNTKYNQPGYYWLTYEWSNLIPLCSKCNHSKSNKFPLLGWSEINRINNHLNANGIIGFDPFNRDWLQAQERPLIINPEIDQYPERHFIYDRNGRVRYRTDEGEETINICDLNRRDLIRTRSKLRDMYVKKIEVAFDEFRKSKNVGELRGELKCVFREIRNGCHVDAEYSLFHTFIYKYFGYFIDEKLPLNLRGQALKFFNEFKKKGII